MTEVKVPDIGDFKDVPVIEVMVRPGDVVEPEDALVTLESDKATMDVPAPAAGTVKALKVKVGDKVSEGSVILLLEAAGGARAAAPTAAPKTSVSPPPAATSAPAGIAEVKVPDIGDFKDVPVIEVLVKAGDTVKAEDPLLTLESDQATMDVPSPTAGTITALKLKVGDKVSEGSLILTLSTGVAGAAAAAPQARGAVPPTAVPSVAPVPTAASYAGAADIECEMLVLGAGPGGYSAAFRAADLGLKTVLVERYATLGGVCLNVGCIPSKALLHTAAVMDAARDLADHGVTFGQPKLDLATLRAFKDKVVGKLTGGLAGMAKARKVDIVRGVGRFLDKNRLQVE